MLPKQDLIRSMQHVLVDLRYEKAYNFNNLIKCNFCNFTLLMPPYLGCPGPSSPSPLHATALTLPISLKLIVSNYSVFVFSKIFELVLNVESNPGVAKLFMQSANSSTNPCRMRHKCRAGVANLFSPCAKIFRHTNIHLKMRHTTIHVVVYLYFEVKTTAYSGVISKKKKKKKGHRLFRCTFTICFGLNMPPNVRPTKCAPFFFFFYLEMLLQ